MPNRDPPENGQRACRSPPRAAQAGCRIRQGAVVRLPLKKGSRGFEHEITKSHVSINEQPIFLLGRTP
jgi:hypothetical protein